MSSEDDENHENKESVTLLYCPYCWTQYDYRCLNCEFDRYSTVSSDPKWIYGYHVKREAYVDRKQAYDLSKSEGDILDSKRNRDALIEQIVQDGGEVWKIMALLLGESKQTPQGPWRIFTIDDYEGNTQAKTCRTLHDVYTWFLGSKFGWKIGYEEVLIELAHRYDMLRQGKYTTSIPDFLEEFFLIIMKMTFSSDSPHEYSWTHITIGESRMLIRPSYDVFLKSGYFDVEVHCASCNDVALGKNIPPGPTQCVRCASSTMDLIRKSGLQRDLQRVFYTYLFANPPP